MRGCDGPAWDIVIRRTKSRNMITGMYVEGGWKEFLSDNNIEVGDTLIMYYKEMENCLRLMQQQRPEASFTCVFNPQSIFQGIIDVPVPFATTHFWTADPCTAVLFRYKREQWCVDLQVVREEDSIISCVLCNGVNMFIEHVCAVVGLGAVIVYQPGFPLLFEVILGPA